MQKVVCFVVLSLLLAGCALGAPGSQPDDIMTIEPTTAVPTQPIEPTEVIALDAVCQQKGYTWDDSICRLIQEGNPQIEIYYPVAWVVQSPLIERTIDTYLSNYLADFEVNFAQNGASSPAAWQLNLAFQVYPRNLSVISIRWDESSYTGGAHGNFGYTTFVFDLSVGQVMSIDDLFVDGVDALRELQQPVRDALIAQLADFSDAQAITAGTDDLSDFEHFVVTDTDLIIYYEPYVLAAGAFGAVEVALPLRDFSLKPQFQ